MLENFILSKRARKAYYLYSGIATYDNSRKRVRGNKTEDMRKGIRRELRI